MKKIISIFFILLFCSSIHSQWIELNTGNDMPLTSISAINDNLLWVSAFRDKVLKSTNGGLNFIIYPTAPVISTYNHIYNIFAIDNETAFISGINNDNNSGVCYKTTNGGVNWFSVFSLPNGFFNALWMKNENEGILTGDPINNYWTIYKTVNGGTNWGICFTAPALTGEVGIVNSMYSIGDYVWIGTSNGRIFYSSNFGISWSIQNLNNNNNEIGAIYFINSQNGFCSGITTFRYTSNSGVNWLTLNYPSPGTFVGIAGNFNELLMGVYGRSVYHTTNLGTNWILEYQLDSGILRRHLTKSRSGGIVWDARSNGKVGKRTNPINIKLIENKIPLSYYLGQNYPNPFNSVTSIKFSVPMDSRLRGNDKVVLRVFDLMGREVATLVNEKLQPGIYSVRFESGNLPSGIYFYRMETEKFTETKKLILLK